MRFPYIRLYDSHLYFSMLAAEHFDSAASLYEADGLVVIVNDPNGIFPFYIKGANKKTINSLNLCRYLISKFGRNGAFFAEPRTVNGFSDGTKSLVMSSAPLDAVILDEANLTPIDFIPLSAHSSISVADSDIRINTLGQLPFFGPVSVLRRGDVFALVPNSKSFINLVRGRNNDGNIYSKAIGLALSRTSNVFPWLWEHNGILFFTANHHLRRSALSTAGFVPLVQNTKYRQPAAVIILKTIRILSVCQRDALKLCHNRYFSLYESGRFMAMSPDENGLYQARFTTRTNGYHFVSRCLCSYLYEKFGGARSFHSRVVNGRLYFSPDRFEKVPSWRSFRPAPDLSSINKVQLYYTRGQKYLHLPSVRNKLPLRVAFYRYKDLWAIAGEENGPYRIWKHKGVIHCAGLIPLIQRTCGCGNEANLFSTFQDGILYFGNRRLDGEIFDFTKFKRVE